MNGTFGSCSTLLSEQTIRTLQGNSSTPPPCRWVSTSQLQILLGAQTAVVAGDTLALRPGTLHPLFVGEEPLVDCSSPSGADTCASGAVVVQPLTTPDQPVALLVAPPLLSLCDELKLDGSQSYGGGIFPLSFEWGVSAPAVEPSKLQPVLQLLSAARSSLPSASVPSSLLLTGVNYTFTLRVRNRAGGVGSASARVVRSPKLLLTSTISGGTEITTLSSSTLSLIASVQLPNTSCAQQGSIDGLFISFMWGIAAVGRSSNDSQHAALMAQTVSVQGGRELILPPHSLLPGTEYIATLIASPGPGGNISAGESHLAIHVGTAPLIPLMLGGALRTASNSSVLTLDVSASYDPDAVGLELTNWSWGCTDAGGSAAAAALFFATVEERGEGEGGECLTPAGEPLVTPGTIGSVLQLYTGELPSARFFYFFATLHAGSRSGKASALVELVASSPPSVLLSIEQPLRAKQGSIVSLTFPSERLVIVGDAMASAGPCTSLQPLDEQGSASCSRAYKWSVLSGDENLIHSSGRLKSTSRYLVLPPGAIGAGGRVRVELAVEDEGGTGRAQIEIQVAVPPVGGAVKVLPTSGDQLNTDFSFAQAGWYASSLPLSYGFDFWSLPSEAAARDCQEQTAGWFPMAFGLRQPSFTTRFLPSGHVVVRATVVDGIGSRNCVFANLSIAQPSISPYPLLANELASMVRNFEMGQQVSLYAVGVLALLLNSGNSSSPPPSNPPSTHASTPPSSPPEQMQEGLLEQMLSILVSLQPSVYSRPEFKRAHAQALAGVISQPEELSDAAIAQSLDITTVLSSSLLPSDARWNVVEPIAQSSARLVQAALVASPPPPPPSPPSPPPSPLQPWPPCPPWPGLPPRWGWRQMEESPIELPPFVQLPHNAARELLPLNHLPPSSLGKERLVRGLQSSPASVRGVIRLLAQYEWRQLVDGEVRVIFVSQLEMTVARGRSAVGETRAGGQGSSTTQLSHDLYELSNSSQLMVLLANLFHSSIGTPPRQGVPQPAAASSVTLIEVEYAGVQQLALPLPTEQQLISLPRGDRRPWLFKCARDEDCFGPAHSNPPVSGRCDGGRCVCPTPWVGDKCERLLECAWYAEGLGWGDRSCLYEADFKCRCNLSGSFDVLVIEAAQTPLKPPEMLGIAPFDLPGGLVYLVDMWTHPQAAILLFSIDGLWLLLLFFTWLCSNEGELQRNARYYQGWHEMSRDQRLASRLGESSRRLCTQCRPFLLRTLLQLKAQHKMFRIFFLSFDIGEDPHNRLNGSQKLTVFVCIVLLRMVVLALQFNPAILEEYEKRTLVQKLSSSILVGLISVFVTIPGTVFLDRIFMHSNKVKVTSMALTTSAAPRIGSFMKVAIRLLLQSSDSRWSLFRWKMVVDQLKIAWVQQELLNVRLTRLRFSGRVAYDISKRHVTKQRSARAGEELAFTPRAKGQHKHRGSHTSFNPEREEQMLTESSGSKRSGNETPPLMLSRRQLPMPSSLPEPTSPLRLLVDAARHRAVVERLPVPQILCSLDEEEKDEHAFRVNSLQEQAPIATEQTDFTARGATSTI
ncbi:MAG: hypothetical protein SGPRY_006506 [Prymnesium sp.]